MSWLSSNGIDSSFIGRQEYSIPSSCSIDMDYEARYRQAQRPKYDCLLFDLDDTLYPLSSGMAASCCKNIADYLVEELGIEESIVPELGNLLYKNYGTTMAGLRAIGYSFDYDDYHRLPYENLKPDPVLRQLLQGLSIRKLVFTNADKVHALEVLKRLGLEDCFEGIICFETVNPPSSSTPAAAASAAGVFDIVGHFARGPSVDGVELPKTPVLCKPSPEAMEQALRIANIDPHRTVFFDDSARNIQAGKRAGLHTVLVGTRHRVKGADYALESIHKMKEALPELWEEAEVASAAAGNIRYSAGNVAMETPVTA
ncbi:hypothetical protein ZIOFF_054473 [Zingiber officinale]|uniref:Uncharacterized protein n=1 Tax=Zingiber officinale TaxID=94328 RepID=A0A8J5FUJ9_ZINOF|nr:hypothetical protein ZIOFF_054473 [Zingiber officinale]